MKERGINILRGFFVALILIAFIHTFVSLFTAGGLISLTKSGITGRITTDIPNNLLQLSPVEKTMLGLEWLGVIFVIVIIFVVVRLRMKHELKESQKISKERIVDLKSSGLDTDLDSLYKLLKEKKTLGLLTIMQIFRVDKDIALEWCNIFEDANIATIKYPTFGEPKLILNGDGKEDGEKEEKKGKQKKEDRKGKKTKG